MMIKYKGSLILVMKPFAHYLFGMGSLAPWRGMSGSVLARRMLGRILHVWVTPRLIRKFVSDVTGQNSLRGSRGS